MARLRPVYGKARTWGKLDPPPCLFERKGCAHMHTNQTVLSRPSNLLPCTQKVLTSHNTPIAALEVDYPGAPASDAFPPPLDVGAKVVIIATGALASKLVGPQGKKTGWAITRMVRMVLIKAIASFEASAPSGSFSLRDALEPLFFESAPPSKVFSEHLRGFVFASRLAPKYPAEA